MTGDGGWAERMAARSREREALKPTPEEAQGPDPRVVERWTAFVESRGGWGAGIYLRSDSWTPADPGDPELVYSHAHGAHGNALIDAANRKLLGVFTVVITEGYTAPDVCPVCESFVDEWNRDTP